MGILTDQARGWIEVGVNVWSVCHTSWSFWEKDGAWKIRVDHGVSKMRLVYATA